MRTFGSPCRFLVHIGSVSNMSWNFQVQVVVYHLDGRGQWSGGIEDGSEGLRPPANDQGRQVKDPTAGHDHLGRRGRGSGRDGGQCWRWAGDSIGQGGQGQGGGARLGLRQLCVGIQDYRGPRGRHFDSIS